MYFLFASKPWGIPGQVPHALSHAPRPLLSYSTAALPSFQIYRLSPIVFVCCLHPTQDTIAREWMAGRASLRGIGVKTWAEDSDNWPRHSIGNLFEAMT